MNIVFQCSAKNAQGPGLAAVTFNSLDPKAPASISLGQLAIGDAEAFTIGAEYNVAITPVPAATK